MGYSPRGCKELDTTEWLNTSLHIYIYIYICRERERQTDRQTETERVYYMFIYLLFRVRSINYEAVLFEILTWIWLNLISLPVYRKYRRQKNMLSDTRRSSQEIQNWKILYNSVFSTNKLQGKKVKEQWFIDLKCQETD